MGIIGRMACWSSLGALLLPSLLGGAGNVEALPVRLYSEDFSGAVGPWWSHNATSVSPSGERFLGEFTNHNITFTLPVPSSIVRIEFDLYILQSWDGNDPRDPNPPPEIWRVGLVGGPLLQQTNFCRTIFDQAYPDSYPGGHHPCNTNATNANALGYGAFGAAIYHLRYDFPILPSFAQVYFSATNLEANIESWGINESWGLDNVTLYLFVPG